MYSIGTILYGGLKTPSIISGDGFWSLYEVLPDLFYKEDETESIALFKNWFENELRIFEVFYGNESNFNKYRIENDSCILAPILYPGKVCCTGANYRKHMSEVGLEENFDKNTVRPSFFHKPPRTSVVGCGKSVRYPIQSKKFDWEIELAVYIGKEAKNVSVQDALNHVAGYSVGMDLSARDYLLHPGNMAGFDSFGGKGFDDSCPLGPGIVPARFIKNPQDLNLKLSVNGEIQQFGNTSDMVWTIAEQISEMSAITTLQPGDVILTGTPPGAAITSGNFLKVGDRIEAEIESVGLMNVEIIDSGIGYENLHAKLK